jgi:hypothetical protein
MLLRLVVLTARMTNKYYKNHTNRNIYYRCKVADPSNFGTRRDANIIPVSTSMFLGSRISMVLVSTLSDEPF